MANISINVFDETSAGSAATNNEVVFIPGYSSLSSAYAISNSQIPLTVDDLPADLFAGVMVGGNPIIAPLNVVNYNTQQWFSREQDTDPFVEQVGMPEFQEDIPILCSTLTEFKSIFGTLPYRFTANIPYIMNRPINDQSSPNVLDVSIDAEGNATIGGVKYTGVYKAEDGYYYGIAQESKEDVPTKINVMWPQPGFSEYAFVNGTNFITQNSYDISHIMACELLNRGMQVVYVAMSNRAETDIGDLKFNIYSPIADMNTIYNSIMQYFSVDSVLYDKNDYNVKYLTTGGYPVFEYNNNQIALNMIQLAETRRDCIALIDHTNYYARVLTGTNSVYGQLFNENSGGALEENGQWGAIYTPYATYTNMASNTEVGATYILPASYGFLACVAKSIQNSNPSWFAVAGVNRGQVPYIQSLYTKDRLSLNIADSYQLRDSAASLNAITNVNPYGLSIWGNHTLKNNAKAGNLTATSFVNIMQLVCEVSKQAYITCKRCMFEQNSDLLWIEFQAQLTPLLDQMISGQGLSSYKILKGETDEKAKLVANIILTPYYSLEDIEVNIRLQDDEVTVS